MRRFVAACVAIVVGAVVLPACGGESNTEKPFTEEQVQRVASAFYRNHEAGGITFSLSTVGSSGTGTVVIEGMVDFVELVGRARVIGGSQPNPVAEVVWGGSTVLEYRPTLRDALVSRGYPDAVFIARPIDVKARRLDTLLSTIMGMGAEQPENAVLVRQREGSAFVREDELRGTKVEVLRYGDRLMLWIDPTTGDLLRFEGTNSARTFPIVIDILSKGKRGIEMPLKARVIESPELGPDWLEWAPQSP